MEVMTKLIAIALAPAPELVEVENDDSGKSEDEGLSLLFLMCVRNLGIVCNLFRCTWCYSCLQ